MNYPEDFTTVPLYFVTATHTGAPVAPSSAFEAADVLIYKNGGVAQKTTTNGITMTSPFDSITGLHRVLIDTSNDTGDAGFWEAGAVYTVILNADETVDGITPLVEIGTFGIALKVTPINVDGITFASAMETILAVLTGVATPSGSTVAFKKRDGTTTKITITYGDDDGERTASTIA